MKRKARYSTEEFSEKYDEYAPMVYRICALRLGNRLDAEDAMQNTFIKFFYKAPEFPDTESEKAWLIRVAINVCKDFQKSFWQKKTVGLDETAELTVYGYRPVMISAQCIMKTRGKCTKNSSFTQMKDRIGEEFLVQNRCDECYNIVYNSAPLYLGTQKVKIQKLSPKRLRIRFGAERKEEVKKVLEQAIDAFGEKPQFDYTQEHFKRGVL